MPCPHLWSPWPSPWHSHSSSPKSSLPGVHARSITVSLAPPTPHPVLSLLQTHLSRMKCRESLTLHVHTTNTFVWNMRGACVWAERCRCIASWCYKTAQLSTVLREKSRHSQPITVLYQTTRKIKTKAKIGESPTKDFNAHGPPGATLSVRGSLLLRQMPVDGGKWLLCQLWQGLPTAISWHCFYPATLPWRASRRKLPLLPSAWGTAQTPTQCCDFSGWAGCAPCGELKRRMGWMHTMWRAETPPASSLEWTWKVTPQCHHPRWPPVHSKDGVLFFFQSL